MSYVKQAAVKAPGGQQKIAEVVLAAAQATVAFNAIPQNYRNLRLVGQARGDTALTFTHLQAQLNGDTGATYDWTEVYGSGSASGGASSYAQTFALLGNIVAANAPATVASGVDALIPNYASTTFDKTIRSINDNERDRAGGYFAEVAATSWRNTAAITSLLLFPGAGNFVAGTVFTLYGEDDLSAPSAVSTVTGAQPSSKVQLDYVPLTDLSTGTSLTTNTWTDVTPAQTFTVDDAASVVDAAIETAITFTNVSTAGDATARLLVDGATAYQVGAVHSHSTGNMILAVTAGGVPLKGLAVGSHTIKLQIYGSTASGTLNWYCRPASNPLYESFSLRIAERKQIAPTTYTPVTNQPNKVQLDWTATTDIANAFAVAAATWTDVPGSSQTFTVDDVASLVDITAWGNVRIVQSGGNAANTRLVIDSGGSAITKMLGGVSSTTDGNALAGADPVTLSGLSAGTHTVKVQVYAGYSGGGTLYVRAASQPNSEFFGIRVIERKTTTSAAVSTALASAHSALAADVSIAANNTYYDGPTLTLGAGTWLVQGTFTGVGGSAAGSFTVRVWDGTTSYVSTGTTCPSAGFWASAALGTVVTLSAPATLRLSAAINNNAPATMVAAVPVNGVGNNATSISAIRVA